MANNMKPNKNEVASTEVQSKGTKGPRSQKGSDVDLHKISKIEIPKLEIAVIRMRLTGDELICNAFSEKSKKEMLDKQMGAAKMKKENKNPQQCFENARLLDTDGRDCVQANGVKLCFVSAARFAGGIPMTLLYPGIFVRGTLLPIECKRVVMREDVVRVGKFPNKTADIRFRPAYLNWSVDCEVEFNSHVFNASQIVNLAILAGFHVGLCEWRPEKRGQYGRFEVQLADERGKFSSTKAA